MGNQYPSLPQDSGNLLGQVEICPTERSEVPNQWNPCLPDSLWWQYLAHAYSQVRFKRTWTEQRLIATYPTRTGNPFYYSRCNKPSYSLAVYYKRIDDQIIHPFAKSESRKATSDFRSRQF